MIWNNETEEVILSFEEFNRIKFRLAIKFIFAVSVSAVCGSLLTLLALSSNLI